MASAGVTDGSAPGLATSDSAAARCTASRGSSPGSQVRDSSGSPATAASGMVMIGETRCGTADEPVTCARSCSSAVPAASALRAAFSLIKDASEERMEIIDER